MQYDCTENSLAIYLEKKMAFTRWEYKTNIKMGDYCIETNSDHTIKTLDPFSAFISLPSNIKHTRKKKQSYSTSQGDENSTRKKF